MLLSRLFEGAPDIEIENLMADSRVKMNNSIFFCIKGMVNDGHKFIPQAKSNGAIVIVHSDDIKEYDADLIYIRVVNVLDTLTPREEKVLRLRFGLDDGRARTLEEVGKEFNVTRERIRQIEAKALRKLRHPSRSKKLKDYLD